MDLLPLGVLRATLVTFLIALPLVLVVRRAHRSEARMTWAQAILLGSWLVALAVLLLAEIPSRLLYWFDEVHAPLAAQFPILSFWEEDLGGNPGYQVIADIVVNSLQAVFFIAICVGAYFWGERHRREGRFKS